MQDREYWKNVTFMQHYGTRGNLFRKDKTMEHRYHMLLVEILHLIEVAKMQEGIECEDLFDLLETIENAITKTVPRS